MKKTLYPEFKNKAESVSCIVGKVKSMSLVFEYVKKLINNNILHTGKPVIAVPQLKDNEISLLNQVVNQPQSVILRNNPAAYAGEIDIGITYADYGISETGTLIIDAKDYDLRVSTMISNLHIVVLKESKIRKTLDELLPQLNTMLEEQAAYLTFITGASRTADIERILVLGVHGPLELHILILEDAESCSENC